MTKMKYYVMGNMKYCYFVERCLSFFFWPLCCLSFDLRLLITPLTSLNFSYGPAEILCYGLAERL